MSINFQDVLTLGLVALSGAYLARRALGLWRPKPAAGGCGGCSGCPSAKAGPAVVSIGLGATGPGKGLT